MGLSIKRLFRSREKPDTEQVKTEDITDQQVQEATAEVCIRELAFWTCLGKMGSMLAKCEFRTFLDGKEVFGDEYFLWNFEPNKNQSKAEFINKAIEKLYRENELLIVESNDGQIFVADRFETKKSTLYGNSYSHVTVDDYEFGRTFESKDVLHWKLNSKNVNQILRSVYNSYSKLIEYTARSYLKSRGSRGILNISALAQAEKNFSEKLKTLMNDYFKSFFQSSNAVLPLYEGYKYEDLGSKTYSEGTSRDIKALYDDIFDFTARGLSMPPSLAKGDVQDTSKAVDEMLTFCLDPLANFLQTEINRKRNGKYMVKKGTRLHIDTTKAKHIDMFDIATPADKLIGSGVFSINMILRAIGEPQIPEEWADAHMMTKNYSDIEDVLKKLTEKGGE